MTTDQKIWFITGTSRGFGRIWAEAALARGDCVVATARNTDALQALVDQYGDRVLPLPLDVCDRKAVFRTVAAAYEHFGRLDVVINNAGYGLFGMVEEVSEQQARAQFETNFFGALWVTQAVLPLMRMQRSGHILQVSTIGGVTAFPLFGLYNASKWALEGMSQALAAEVREFGIKVTLIEPTAFATEWAGNSAVHATPRTEYDGVRQQVLGMWSGQTPGQPEASAAAVLALVDAEQPPLRVFFGDMLGMMQAEYGQRLHDWEQWQALAIAARG
ncbi:SDR family NAD(P)-dependent oxidoreductase [Pokkaliibacter sp. MBI-7]|uniref:SDR family NAD(P)-dependent oxidoreductase n=1 Tax=Pokkaliibacter sp. MBI-7 TaxID=3040600 RepID=UPI0024499D0B|nr:SDR family NAD(P)-dependent oxidoreductase [Pokkaliibacter sp. MBI-7]MDH2433701.1 SDR family NAD(P)-dependent oxidoreductase [Pokkaliibacter sp. MBI-7]